VTGNDEARRGANLTRAPEIVSRDAVAAETKATMPADQWPDPRPVLYDEASRQAAYAQVALDAVRAYADCCAGNLLVIASAHAEGYMNRLRELVDDIAAHNRGGGRGHGRGCGHAWRSHPLDP
jgi:hypothetical protein